MPAVPYRGPAGNFYWYDIVLEQQNRPNISCANFKTSLLTLMSIIEVNLMGEHKIIRKDRTKNKKSFRTYPLIPQIEMFLDWELQQQEKQRELMGSCYYMGDQEYICLDANGHLLRPDYVTSKFSELVKKRGLKKITFHGLRHPYVKPTTKKFITFFEVFRAAS